MALSPADRSDLIAYVQAGGTGAEAARRYGITPQAVSKIMRKARATEPAAQDLEDLDEQLRQALNDRQALERRMGDLQATHASLSEKITSLITTRAERAKSLPAPSKALDTISPEEDA